VNIKNINIEEYYSNIDQKLVEKMKKEANFIALPCTEPFWDETRLYFLYFLWKKEDLSLRMIVEYVKLHFGRSISRDHITKKLRNLEKELLLQRSKTPELFESEKDGSPPFLLKNTTKTSKNTHFSAHSTNAKNTEKQYQSEATEKAEIFDDFDKEKDTEIERIETNIPTKQRKSRRKSKKSEADQNEQKNAENDEFEEEGKSVKKEEEKEPEILLENDDFEKSLEKEKKPDLEQNNFGAPGNAKMKNEKNSLEKNEEKRQIEAKKTEEIETENDEKDDKTEEAESEQEKTNNHSEEKINLNGNDNQNINENIEDEEKNHNYIFMTDEEIKEKLQNNYGRDDDLVINKIKLTDEQKERKKERQKKIDLHAKLHAEYKKWTAKTRIFLKKDKEAKEKNLPYAFEGTIDGLQYEDIQFKAWEIEKSFPKIPDEEWVVFGKIKYKDEVERGTGNGMDD